jgi:hypothetical protein
MNYYSSVRPVQYISKDAGERLLYIRYLQQFISRHVKYSVDCGADEGRFVKIAVSNKEIHDICYGQNINVDFAVAGQIMLDRRFEKE